MRILYVSPLYPPAIGGAQIQLHCLAKAAQAAGAEVQVLTNSGQNRTDWLRFTTVSAEPAGSYEYEGVPVRRIGFSNVTKLCMAPWVASYYAAIPLATRALARLHRPYLPELLDGYDVIHFTRIGREFLARACLDYAKAKGIPFVFTPNHHPRWRGWRYVEYDRIYREADALAVYTQSEKETLANDIGVQAERIHVTGVGPIVCDTYDLAKFRKDNALGKHRYVLFLGQQYEYKGMAAILKAMPKVWEEFPDLRMLFIGPHTPYSQELFGGYFERQSSVSIAPTTNDGYPKERQQLLGMAPVLIDTKAFADVRDPSKLRKVGRQLYREFVGLSVVNQLSKRTIQFTKNQFGKPLSHSADPRIMRIIGSLPDLISVAIPICMESEIYPEKYVNISEWHTYAAAATLDEESVFITITTFEVNVGGVIVNLYHDHNVISAEKLTGGIRTAPQPHDGVGSPESRLTSKLYQWWHETDNPSVSIPEPRSPRVLNLGAVPMDVKAAALAGCAFLCMPSMQESFGGVYVEAWHYGKAVIGGDIPAIRCVIDDGENGLVTTQDPAQLAERMLTLLRDPALCERMGAAGRAKGQREFSWDTIARRALDIYDGLLAPRRSAT